MSTTVPAATGSGRSHAHRWPAAIVLMIGALMDLVDATIVNVALPTVRDDLHASATQLEWIVSAYMLAFAAGLIAAGRLGDRIGRRRLFVTGVAAFAVASLLCGLSRSPGELIAARALEGAAAATLLPQVLATLRSLFTGAERGAVFGIYGAVSGLAVALGVLAGGLLTDADLFGWSWRTIFLVNLPIAAAVLPAALILVPESRDRDAPRLDAVGTLLLAASLVAIVLPLAEGRALGWPAWCPVLIAAGLLGLAALGRLDARERPGIAPLLPTRLLRVPAFATGVVVQLGFGAGLQGISLAFTLWLAGAQHFSPTHIGLTYLVLCAGSFASAGPAIPLATRFGRLVLVAGAGLMAAGTAVIGIQAHQAAAPVSTWALAPALFVIGFGLCLLAVPLINVVLSAVPPRIAGEASAVFSTAQQLGGAIGVALTGTVFFARVPSPGFASAFTATAPWLVGGFLVVAVLALALPKRALAEVDL
jgi:EmrB/QacA subfamily drug resistance transporter